MLTSNMNNDTLLEHLRWCIRTLAERLAQAEYDAHKYGEAYDGMKRQRDELRKYLHDRKGAEDGDDDNE